MASYRDELIKITSKLVSIPSVNPPGDTSQAASYVADLLSENGISARLVDEGEGRVSLVARIGSGRPRVLLNGHLDVVPEGDRSRWSFDPFSGEVRNGKVLGRGAADMKGGCAALISSFLRLAREGVEQGEVVLALVADEEAGGKYGTSKLVERGELEGDFALVAEPTGLSTCVIGEKGHLWLLLKALGKPAHGSMAGYAGDNAIERLTKALSSVKGLAGKKARTPRSLAPAVEGSKRLLRSLTGKRKTSEVVDSLTVNIGVIRGGVKVNVVPDSAEAEVDLRLPIGETVKSVLKRVERALKREGIKAEVISSSEPNYTDPKLSPVQELVKKVEEVTGKRIGYAIIWGATDARYLRAAGTPTVVYGPGDWSLIHAYDEWVSVEEVVMCEQVYYSFLKSFLGGGGWRRP